MNPRPSFSRYVLAWLVHLLTASTAVVAVLTLYAIYQKQFVTAFWFMGIAIFIDAIDGTFARRVGVKDILPQIDGALLDNIVDFLNYVITPCFFLLVEQNMLPHHWQWAVVIAIALCSTYQFTQSDAKTPDHFFKGFPCYWNLVIFYLYLFHTSPLFNAVLLLVLCFMVFIPIKYVYPSRLDYLTPLRWLKNTMLVASILYGLNNALLLLAYPNIPTLMVVYAASYGIFYFAFSIVRTSAPLITAKLK